jgi:hypothetical protein
LLWQCRRVAKTKVDARKELPPTVATTAKRADRKASKDAAKAVS